jgi:hypothetical protein
MAISNYALQNMLLVAGLGQLGLALGSLAIPKLLKWPQELRRLSPLTRQVFWVYAVYIWTSHVAFAIVSVTARQALTDGTLLAICVTAFIAFWWGARLAIQFVVLDRSATQTGAVYRWGEAVLVTLFVCFTTIYGYAAVSNFLTVVR